MGRDIESPYSLVADVGSEPPCTSDDPVENVRCYMNRGTSRLAITFRDGAVHDGVRPPENLESLQEHWVFFLRLTS